MPLRTILVTLVVAASLLLGASSCTFVVPPPTNAAPALKIGLLLNFTGSPEASADRERAFNLAIGHINAGGGVLGQPVTGITADATSDPQVAVERARHLIQVEDVHALVGPNASSAALPVAETVAGPAGIPVISPSATSPQLTTVPDNDFFFRTALSDAIQGPILAAVTRERGFDNVGLIYFNDAYGQGLAAAFAQGWEGTLQAAALERNQTTYLNILRESAQVGAQALVVVAAEDQALAIVRSALDEGFYDQFIFGDAAKRLRLVKEIGGSYLGGMYGTAGASAPANDATAEWESSFLETYGSLPVLAYVKETYDATIALALAAQAAGSFEGLAIRDQLREIGSLPGQIVLGTPAGIADVQQNVYFGQGAPQSGSLPRSSWAYVEGEEITYDPAGAKALLAEAGYPDGFDLTIKVIAGVAVMENVATIWQNGLAEAGVNLTVEIEDLSTWLDNYVGRTYQTIANWMNVGGDPHSMYDIIFKPHLKDPESYPDEEMLGWISEGAANPDLEARKAIYQKIQERVLNEVAPVIVVQSQPLLAITTDKVQGWTMNGKGDIFFTSVVVME